MTISPPDDWDSIGGWEDPEDDLPDDGWDDSYELRELEDLTHEEGPPF